MTTRDLNLYAFWDIDPVDASQWFLDNCEIDVEAFAMMGVNDQLKTMNRLDEFHVAYGEWLDGSFDIKPYVGKIWIAQVGWKEAGVYGNLEKYVPTPALNIYQLCHDAPLVGPSLIHEMMVSFNVKNQSHFKVQQAGALKRWLQDYPKTWIIAGCE